MIPQISKARATPSGGCRPQLFQIEQNWNEFGISVDIEVDGDSPSTRGWRYAGAAAYLSEDAVSEGRDGL
jgi:hypothetical protein